MTPVVVFGGISVVRCFAACGVPIVVVATNPDEVALRSRFAWRTHVVTGLDEPERLLADLERIGRSLPGRPPLYYGGDETLLFINRHRDALAEHFRFRMPNAELIETMVDKRRFGELATQLGLPVPVTLSSRELGNPDELLARMPLPCILKPENHIGWEAHAESLTGTPQKALIASTPDELRRHWADSVGRGHDCVVQQYIPGGEDQIHSFHAYVDERGQVRGSFVGKKIRTYPRQAGVSTFLQLIKEPRVVEIGLEVVRRCSLIGPLKIDMKKDPRSGDLFVLEVNPRFNLWHYLGAVSGVNLPRLAYDDLLGKSADQPATEYRTAIKWLTLDGDLRSFLRSYRPAGELGWLEWLDSLRGPKIYGVFAWNDPAPWATALLRWGRQRLFRLRPP
jgi:predicted ATP-grasp superfamily ATP-dependent carboligase